MVLGILGLALCWFPVVGWLCALVGVILGALGMSKAKKVGGRGKGMAVAGLVCGIVGLAIGLLLFVLTMMATRAIDDYMTKGRKNEAQLQLRRIESQAKAFYFEKGRLPAAAAPMPKGPAVDCVYRREPEAAWEANEGWRELAFAIHEDSKCTYEIVTASPREAKAIARCDLDCDGTASVVTMTLGVASGHLTATYTDPTPD